MQLSAETFGKNLARKHGIVLCSCLAAAALVSCGEAATSAPGSAGGFGRMGTPLDETAIVEDVAYIAEPVATAAIVTTTTAAIVTTTQAAVTTTEAPAPVTTTRPAPTTTEAMDDDYIQLLVITMTLNDRATSQESCEAIYAVPPEGYDAGWAVALDSFEEGAETTLGSESRSILREFYDQCFWSGDWSGW